MRILVKPHHVSGHHVRGHRVKGYLRKVPYHSGKQRIGGVVRKAHHVKSYHRVNHYRTI